jgi:BirA family biotin operon repressor/biotin-[acetyl-CoA-carboxylase] ligase
MSRKSRSKPFESLPLVQGYKSFYHDTVPSTNEVARELARKGCKERTVVVAEKQTQGKGRLGRQWVSPKGGIWLSIVLRPEMSSTEASKITFITASAVVETIQQLYALDPLVKWPNDVLIHGKKICGILTEASTRAGIVQFVIVGVGINVNIDLKSFPPTLKGEVTTLKHELGHAVERQALTNTLLRHFDHRYSRLRQGEWRTLLQEWKNAAAFLHKPVRVTSFDETFLGEAVDVDLDGALLVRLDTGVLKRVLAGDIELRTQI